MNEREAARVARLQKNLKAIRKIGRITSQELAHDLDISRQTLNALEAGRTRMTKIQYIAIRDTLNFRAAQQEGQALAQALVNLVDDPVEPDDDEAPSAMSTQSQVTSVIAGKGLHGMTAGMAAMVPVLTALGGPALGVLGTALALSGVALAHGNDKAAESGKDEK